MGGSLNVSCTGISGLLSSLIVSTHAIEDTVRIRVFAGLTLLGSFTQCTFFLHTPMCNLFNVSCGCGWQNFSFVGVHEEQSLLTGSAHRSSTGPCIFLLE